MIIHRATMYFATLHYYYYYYYHKNYEQIENYIQTHYRKFHGLEIMTITKNDIA